MIFQRIILPSITLLLVICHITILYFWVFDWKKLVTNYGLIIWIGSTFLGILIYMTYRILKSNTKIFVIAKKAILFSTLMVIILGLIAIIIELITSSMP
jgi:hypothetical protein